MNKQEIRDIIHLFIDELNQQLPDNGKQDKSPSATLIGEGGVLDSLSLVTLLVNIEQALSDKDSIKAPLLDTLMSPGDGQNPFKTISALTDWISEYQHSRAG